MSGPSGFSAGAFQGFKKAEDVTETLRGENLELKRLLNNALAENTVLKAQLKSLSVVLDKAIHSGFTCPNYDISAGRELAKKVGDSSVLQMKETERRGDLAKGSAITDGNEGAASSSQDKQRDKRRFAKIAEFDEHKGSVMCARFSPTGNLIASGSFDKSVRVFDVFDINEKKLQLDGHGMMVSHVCWHPDSSYIASASFDSTCKLWDVGTGSLVSDFVSPVNGFMLSNTWSTIDLNTFLASHSSNHYYWFDRRAGMRPQANVRHNCMVNTMQMLPSGHLLLGDRSGMICTRDARMITKSLVETAVDPAPDAIHTPVKERATPALHSPSAQSAVHGSGGAPLGGFDKGSFQVTQSNAQVSHICIPENGPDDIVARYLGVNAYDNILRIYDRGSLASETEKTKSDWISEPKMACKLMGQDLRLNGYPIHSSFWAGEQAGGKPKPVDERTIDDTMLMVCGSCPTSNTDEQAACPAYVYDITDIRRGGTGVLLQKLSGHSDHVYGMHSHPKMPLLISYSADCSIKLWSGRRH